VFAASAAVLVLEILAVRMLAPYVGLTLETYTSIIGVVLLAIAAGSAAGGRLADRVPPRRLVGPLLVAGGLLAMLTVPAVRALAGALAILSFVPPAAVLSALTPVMAKWRLADLREAGTVVGGLSAWATAGALAGTFLAGFVFVPLLPVRATVVAVGALLVVAGLVLWRGGSRLLVAAGAAVLATATVAVGSPCDAESAYFCARVEADGATGRVLVLDDLQHSYVDLADPTRLEFPYVQRIAEALDRRDPRDVVFLGGGGFTLPRWVLTRRADARATVLELDPELVRLARERLGLRRDPRLRVLTGDARVRLRDLPARSADVVVGDAFGGRSVPWQLTTEEFLRDVRRVLRPGGLYVMNVIDFGPLRLARAQAATLGRVFAHVATAEPPGDGNLVLLASDRPAGGVPADAFARGARVLTDDHAPADQLLESGRR